MKCKSSVSLVLGILIGMVLAIPLYAQIVSWGKDQVTPVVLVEPGIGGFRPVQGSAIGNTWPKDKVVPMCIVKPGIGGFVPKEGTSIGNTWSRDAVRPVVMVQPAMGRFVPGSNDGADGTN